MAYRGGSSLTRSVVFLASSLLAAAGTAAAQAAIQLPATTSCQPCRVVLERVVTLGAAEDGSVLREPLWMSRDSRGRFYVTYATIGHGPELAAIFDST